MRIFKINDNSCINLDYISTIELNECKICIFFINGTSKDIECTDKENAKSIYKRIIRILEELSRI